MWHILIVLICIYLLRSEVKNLCLFFLVICISSSVTLQKLSNLFNVLEKNVMHYLHFYANLKHIKLATPALVHQLALLDPMFHSLLLPSFSIS